MKKIEGRARTQEGKRLYWVWAAMIQRCHNPSNPAYRNYGAKGVAVCERWRSSFDHFASDMGPRPSGMTLDRIDSSMGYGPSNCRWATREQQSRNRPGWCLVVDGRPLLDVWQNGAHPSVSYRNFRKRLRLRGWSLDEALTRPERGSSELHGYRRPAA